MTIVSDGSSPRRKRSSSVEEAGNFGARPKPPNAGSNVAAMPRAASVRSADVSGSADGFEAAVARSVPSIRADCCYMSSRRSRQVSETARRSSGKLGMPCRGSGGKYVPA